MMCLCLIIIICWSCVIQYRLEEKERDDYFKAKEAAALSQKKVA